MAWAETKNVPESSISDKHQLDRYGVEEAEYCRFNPDLQQALAWRRFAMGLQNDDDKIQFKHEIVERRYKKLYGAGYSGLLTEETLVNPIRPAQIGEDSPSPDPGSINQDSSN